VEFFGRQVREPRLDVGIPREALSIEVVPSRIRKLSVEPRLLLTVGAPGPGEHGPLGVSREEIVQGFAVPIPEFGSRDAPSN
jgi:hypothetical protein